MLVRVATSWPVRVVVTVGLLVGLALWIDWGQVAKRLEEGRWELFAVGILVVAGALVIAALRWRVFLRAGGVPASVPETLRAYGIGMFANNFLPTGFGGDAARALVIRSAGASTGRAVASVIVDRGTALGCLLLLAWLALAIEPSDVPGSLIAVLVIASVAGIALAAAFVLVARRAARPEARWVARQAGRAYAHGRVFAGSRSVIVFTTVLGVAYQGAIVLASWILARSIDLDVSFAVLAVVTPLVIVATLMPISIAGFGVREGSYVALLSAAGVSAADATLLSLLNVAALAIATLPGAAAMLLPAATPRERAPAP